VIGLHILGPNAGEITQGYALGMRLGAKKKDFDDMTGIHPTDSENFTTLSITKSSGAQLKFPNCCG
jgi:thioredoxin reductase (NADPH)